MPFPMEDIRVPGYIRPSIDPKIDTHESFDLSVRSVYLTDGMLHRKSVCTSLQHGTGNCARWVVLHG